MKKKLVVSILTAVITAAMLGGCGKGSAETPTNENVAAESKEENEKEDAPEMEAEPEETAEETGGPETSAAKETDWLEEHGLSITPQGEFTFKYKVVYDQFVPENTILGVESETANMTVTETIVEGRYKKIEAVLACDFTGVEKYAGEGEPVPTKGMFCFDRYTGIAVTPSWRLEEAIEEEENSYKEKGLPSENSIRVVTGDSNDTKGYKLTVFCPEDYDGVVFGVKCFSEGDQKLLLPLANEFAVYSIGGEHGFDVEPYLDEDCIFFTASNE